MRKKPLDGTWPAWLQENLDRKCDPEQLLAILLKNGFDLESIVDHMGLLFPSHSTLLRSVPRPKTLPTVDYALLSQPRLTRPDSGLNAFRMLNDKIQLYLLDGFMTSEECDRIVEISATHLRPSTVTTGDRDKYYRTSSTSDLSLLADPFVEQIDEKIGRTLGIRLPYSEGIQAQRYEVGQEFKEHTDFFAAGTGEYATYAGTRGQRTWTFMVYLNEGMKGGGTKFVTLDKTLTPKKGTAVIWNNLLPDGRTNPDTLHSGMPVEAGHKVIITKWFRDRGTGPLFYED